MSQTRKGFVKPNSPLLDTGWLPGLSEPLRHWILENGRWLNIPAGTALFREGDETVGMYGVETGAVDIEFAPEGMDNLVTVRVGPGHWLGQSVLLPTMRRPFNLVTSVDSQVYNLSRNAVRTLLTDQPEFWPEFYELALMQVIAMMSYLGEAQWLPPQVRVARQLLRLSVVDSSVDLGQAELVALTGMSRSNVRRALKTLSDAGIIDTQYRSIKVLDPARLKSQSHQNT
jgi:CRP-like cAMP-binding protein